MQLTINKITEDDQGDYYCHAENAFGVATQPVSVRIRNTVSMNRELPLSSGYYSGFAIIGMRLV